MKQKIKQLPDFEAEIPRFCLNCGKPLPKGEHKLRKFCTTWWDQFGAVHDCKSDFHTQQNKPENDEFREYRKSILNDTQIIEELISKFGGCVTTAQLNAYNLWLTRSLRYSITEDGKIVSIFHKYMIISDTASGLHQIQTHE